MLRRMPRAPRSTGTWLLGASVVMLVLAPVAYVFWDRAVAEWAFHLPRNWANLARVLSTIGTGGYWIAAAVLVAVTALLIDRRRLAAWALQVGCALAVSGLAAIVVKVIVGRARPRALDQGEWGFRWFQLGYRFNSFPSGHAAIAASLAAALCLRRPAAWPGAILLWLALAGGRVMTGAHFVSDVLAGGAVGIAVMVMVERWTWLDRLLHRFQKVEGRPAARDDAGETSRADATVR